MPVTGTLDTAMRRVFVEPRYDVGDNNSEVPFLLNIEFNAETDELWPSFDWDSAALNADRFWVAYVLTGFQGATSDDNDADPESDELQFLATPIPKTIAGWTHSTSGGSVLFYEVIYGEPQNDPDRLFAVATAHEVAHAVASSAKHPILRSEPPSDPTNPDYYVPEYANLIRSALKPRLPAE